MEIPATNTIFGHTYHQNHPELYQMNKVKICNNKWVLLYSVFKYVCVPLTFDLDLVSK